MYIASSERPLTPREVLQARADLALEMLGLIKAS